MDINLNSNRPSFSFEVFPPKKECDIENIYKTISDLSALSPDFMSVTYGAGGSTNKNTISISEHIQNTHNIPAIAHLTCISSTFDTIETTLKTLREKKINTILALRGDFPADKDGFNLPKSYSHAVDLIMQIKAFGGFKIGAACYPEGHIENPNKNEDIKFIKEKADAGCDFLTTQFFFDNNHFYSFLEKLYFLDVKIPVFAGVMPITHKSQIKKMCALSGAEIPEKLKKIIDVYGDDPDSLRDAGIAYATEQIIELLANKVSGIHIYTMNKFETSSRILNNISSIRKGFSLEN